MLKLLVLQNKLKQRNSELEKFIQLRADIKQQALEVETALNEINENSTDEERKAVEDRADELDKKNEENEENITSAQDDIANIEKEIIELRSKGVPQPPSSESTKTNERTVLKPMNKRTRFFNLNYEERTAFFESDNVKNFLQRVRTIGAAAAAQNRSVSGADLEIPTEILEIIRENITDYSKLINRVRLIKVRGKSRQTIMAEIQEAIWTEMCASLNELEIRFNAVDIDGYKVGAFIAICKSTLEDSDEALASNLIESLLISQGIAIDKAIFYGLDNKMPLGIVTRLAQTEQPSNYPITARPWKDLSSSNVITIPNEKTGIEFFKALLLASGAAKGRYSRGVKFWAMNDTTLTQIKAQALTMAQDGHVVSMVDGVMPVIGGDIIVLDDSIIPDGNIVGGYGDLYLLAEREGAIVERSDECRFIEDQVVFKGTARYDGEPVIPEAFVAVGLGSAPETSTKFAFDTANDATLASLSLGTETISPTFDSLKYAYTVTASGTSGVITATPAQPGAKLDITYDGKPVVNNQNVKFETGTKDLVIKVTKGLATLAYTISITKS